MYYMMNKSSIQAFKCLVGHVKVGDSGWRAATDRSTSQKRRVKSNLTSIELLRKLMVNNNYLIYQKMVDDTVNNQSTVP